jgi:hypothetical protein
MVDQKSNPKGIFLVTLFISTYIVQAWIEIHKDELMADWELAIDGENIFKIDPLK